MRGRKVRACEVGAEEVHSGLRLATKVRRGGVQDPAIGVGPRKHREPVRCKSPDGLCGVQLISDYARVTRAATAAPAPGPPPEPGTTAESSPAPAATAHARPSPWVAPRGARQPSRHAHLARASHAR